jgi:hypothetical protein
MPRDSGIYKIKGANKFANPHLSILFAENN